MLGFRIPGAALIFLLVACSGGGSGTPEASGGAGSGGMGGTAGSTAGAAAGAQGGGGRGGAGDGAGGSGGDGGSSGAVGTAGYDGGVPDAGQNDGSTSDGGGLHRFAAVQSIIATNCVRCHDPAHPVVPETQTYIALSLTMKDAYASLVSKPATEMCGGTLVTPGDPSKSYLYAKVTQDAPCSGERMPHQGMIRTPPLPADKIAVIESWIHDGAKP
jgi:hypothetical protein